jgi:hypothetical protein
MKLFNIRLQAFDGVAANEWEFVADAICYGSGAQVWVYGSAKLSFCSGFKPQKLLSPPSPPPSAADYAPLHHIAGN